MRIPQVTDRMKEAPAQALRTVFGGIGRLLLIADRIKNQEQEPARDPAEPAAAQRKEPGEPGEPGARPAAPTSYDTRWRSLDKTGNVRLLGAEDLADGQPGAGTAPQPAAPPSPAVPKPAAPEPAAPEPAAPEPAAREPAAPEPAPAAAALPVPNYDGLTVASLRARLRGLDQAQLGVLVQYERAHANREAVAAMFERRIAKLDRGEG